ncbi:MAG: carboxypeptidase M32 [Alphaproteobacteria bacterium CG11_big_fil_rev_8_21_14_0_20_39_49]|nr:MAG: carboxypeptidase M32 [Alphaproteobacteria bacterium CG11_big_fil_rev_8_21_14_0_20_39_49]
MDNYKTLEKIFKKLNDIEQASAVLHWDMATKMPSGGAEARAEQLATLGDIYHAILTDEGVGDLLESAGINGRKLNDWQKANLNEMKRAWNHNASVPAKLISELTREGAKCEIVWRDARANNDFKMLLPHLKKVVSLVREIAKLKGEAFGCSPYDALLDRHDPDRKSKQLDTVFDNLKEFLPDFINQVVEKQKSEKVTKIKGPFDVEKQKMIAEKMLEVIGFDMDYGRLDESLHPFCGGYPTDIRITTRYDKNDFISALMGVVHEAGHAMYEEGLPKKWLNQPVGKARGMSIHESQSLLIEMQACRSREFVNLLSGVLKKEFNSKSKSLNPDNLCHIYNKVEPSLIRVDADEVTYPAHIILRYYIEKYIISGDMEVEDLPEAWNQGMKKFLGIKVKDDKDGCMQDIHWMDGTFGYFPTYTLGAIYASQLFDAANHSNNDIMPSIGKGDFKPLKEWLNKNVHEKGSKMSSDEIVKSATGRELDVEVYKNHLKKRYLEG